MMEKQKGKYVFECDGCNEVNETDEKDFDDARDKIKKDGWRIIFDDGTFVHYCPSCVKSL